MSLQRIVSRGHRSGQDFWYEQDEDEWALVLEGEAGIGCADGREIFLSKGDSLFLPAKLRHRVLYTSDPCVWLTLHGHFGKFIS
ncbi:MAG: cupin domain-containing protein [Desulfovibrio sp.]|nr:cupin domain-containing protein [Desulfovibrio sp.]